MRSWPSTTPACPSIFAHLGNRPRVVIEDAAHALGALTPGGPVGNCAHSEMCCFSFHPVKPITTAEGGVVTTNSDEYAEALRRFRIARHRPPAGAWRVVLRDRRASGSTID